MRRLAYLIVGGLAMALGAGAVWLGVPRSQAALGFFAQALTYLAGTAILGTVVYRMTSKSALDAAAGRVETPTIIAGTLLASGMVAVAFVAARFGSEARDCLAHRLDTDEVLGFTAAIPIATLFLSFSSLAFALWHSWTPTADTRKRRWLTACVYLATAYALLGFPAFINWIFITVEC